MGHPVPGDFLGFDLYFLTSLGGEGSVQIKKQWCSAPGSQHLKQHFSTKVRCEGHVGLRVSGSFGTP